MTIDVIEEYIDTGEVKIFTRRHGNGPPVLLIHGFPETHLMWEPVTEILSRDFTTVCVDLRGYGKSGCPATTPDHFSYSKRAMAADLTFVMAALGFKVFAVVGHDRGARVAYRLALDSPERVSKLAVLDIVPTGMTWERADSRLALALWPWSLLAQPAPFPERLILGCPEAIIDAFSSRDANSAIFKGKTRSQYLRMLEDPVHVHAICEDYRAGASIDRVHDRSDQEADKKIQCPVYALWSARGITQAAHEEIGGPLALWKKWANDVSGKQIDAGHFFPEELPIETADILSGFLLS